MSDTAVSELDQLRHLVLQRLESLERAGVRTLPKPQQAEAWLLTNGEPEAANGAKKEAASSAPSRFDLKPTNLRSAAMPPSPPPGFPINTNSEAPMPRSAAGCLSDESLPQTRAQRVA